MTRLSATQVDTFHPTVVIRRAGDDDRGALARLAALDSAKPLRGEVLVAVVDLEPWAAVSLDDGRVIADPFRASGVAAELLRVRARHLRGGAGAGAGALVARRGLRARRASV